MISPGWQSSTLQIFSIAETGNCFTEPTQIAEIVGARIPVASESSFCVIPFSASKTFKRYFNGISLAPFYMLLYYELRSISTRKELYKLRKTYWLITIFVV